MATFIKCKPHAYITHDVSCKPSGSTCVVSISMSQVVLPTLAQMEAPELSQAASVCRWFAYILLWSLALTAILHPSSSLNYSRLHSL